MPSFSYNENTPQANEVISETQGDILTNFASISGLINVDHYTFESASSNDGYHKKSTYPVQTSDPGSASGQAVLYSKNVSPSSELFLQRDAVATAIQMTFGLAGVGASSAYYQSFLPGGLQLRMGRDSGTAPTYAGFGLSDFPNGTLVVILQEIGGASRFPTYTSANKTGFTVNAGVTTYGFIAIGY